MNFQKWLMRALSTHNPDRAPIGQHLVNGAAWVNEEALWLIGSEGIADIANPYSPELFDWLSKLERAW